MICPRCTKNISNNPIHTCNPSPLVLQLEQRIAELEAEVVRLRAEIAEKRRLNMEYANRMLRIRAEIDALQHDVSRHVAICSEQATRIAELEVALEKYGSHPTYCQWYLHGDCTCGLIAMRREVE